VPLGGADEQGLPVRAAEHQRERRAVLVEFDPLQDFTTVGHPDNGESARLAPDRAVGVQADAVWPEPLGEHPPPRQSTVGVDVERGEPARERLGDDQRPAVGGDDHAVGELDVASDLTQLPARRNQLDVARLGRLAGHEAEVRAVDVGVAAGVHDDLVRPLTGVDNHRPVGLLAPHLVAGGQQPAVGQPVDGIPHGVAGRVAAEHNLGRPVHVDGHDLPVDPVAEPQPPVMPPRRLRNSQATQENLRFRHNALFSLRPCRSPAGRLPQRRATTSLIVSA